MSAMVQVRCGQPHHRSQRTAPAVPSRIVAGDNTTTGTLKAPPTGGPDGPALTAPSHADQSAKPTGASHARPDIGPFPHTVYRPTDFDSVEDP